MKVTELLACTMAMAGAFLAPLLYGLYWKRTTTLSVWVTFASGVGIMCADMYCRATGQVFITPFLTSPINAGVLAMGAGLVIVPVVSLITRRLPKADVDEMFLSYDHRVVVKATDALAGSVEE